MKATNQRFTKLIDGKTQFVIPVFQRDFSWTREQCEQFWQDIGRANDGKDDSAHFMGSIVYIGSELAATFASWLLIDGQQRLTTLTLLMVAMRDHIRASSWFGSDDGPTIEKIDAYFLKNTLESGRVRFSQWVI